MSKITLDVEKKDLDTVLTILNNLKSGLVKNVKVDNKPTNSMQAKKPVRKPVLEDEFMNTKPSGSKYLSPSAFKNRINQNGK